MSSASTTTPPTPAPKEDEGSFELEPNQLVWGVSTSVALVYGFMMYYWYPHDIKGNNIAFPDASGTNVSETWALETREISAWDSAAMQMILVNLAGATMWGLNLALGGNGNIFHRLFYITTNAMRFSPILALYHALYIQRQYLPNGAVYD